jgi:hypothetical protein
MQLRKDNLEGSSVTRESQLNVFILDPLAYARLIAEAFVPVR